VLSRINFQAAGSNEDEKKFGLDIQMLLVCAVE
jgi:hypothetical protein